MLLSHNTHFPKIRHTWASFIILSTYGPSSFAWIKSWGFNCRQWENGHRCFPTRIQNHLYKWITVPRSCKPPSWSRKGQSRGNSPGGSEAASAWSTLKEQSQRFVRGCTETVRKETDGGDWFFMDQNPQSQHIQEQSIPTHEPPEEHLGFTYPQTPFHLCYAMGAGQASAAPIVLIAEILTWQNFFRFRERATGEEPGRGWAESCSPCDCKWKQLWKTSA